MLEFKNIWAMVYGKNGEEYKELKEYSVKRIYNATGSTISCWIVSSENQVSCRVYNKILIEIRYSTFDTGARVSILT